MEEKYMKTSVWKNKTCVREKLTRQLSEKAAGLPNPKNISFNNQWQKRFDELLELEIALGAAGANT
jgi:hypothetical protein